jgi:tetratricopeptide (TPR) repeat protein
MPRATIVVLSLCVFLFAQAAIARDWVAYNSDNFTVYSDAREAEALKVIENFEIFRRATLGLLNLPDTAESERLTILMFDRVGDFYRIKPPGNVGGFFYHSIFGPRMIVGPSGAAAATQVVLFHEYVHYLVNRHSDLNYPRWYSEGFATLLSSADITETSVIIGRPPQGFSQAISLGLGSTVSNVIDTKYDGPNAEFYVTAWLMTHYFLIDSVTAAKRRAQTVDYLRRYDAGEDPVEAFSASYGATAIDIQRELAAYRTRRQLTGIVLPRPEYAGQIHRRVLDPGEDRYRLGDVAIELDNFEAAYRFLDDFDDLGIDSEFTAKARSRRAIGLMHEEEIAKGDTLIEALIALPLSDPDVLADIAHYAFDRYTYDNKNSVGDAARQLSRSIEYGERAVAGAPGDLEALYYLGLANEKNGNLQLAANALLTAYASNRSSVRLNTELVRVLIKGQQPEFASFLISRLYSATHSEEARAKFRKLLKDIENGTVDMAELEQ